MTGARVAGAGFSFQAGRESFLDIDDEAVRVGRLEKLLRAKELAGRPKDVEFLRLYAARLRELAAEP